MGNKMSRTAVYGLVQEDQPKAVYLETLNAVLPALRELTGEEVDVSDLIAYEPDTDETDDQDLLLASGTADLQATLDDLESDLPPGEVDVWLETFYTAAAENSK